MRPKFLLDTVVLGGLATHTPDTRVLVALGEHSRACAVPAPVWQELLTGCRRLDDRQRPAFERFLWEVVFPCFRILPYDRVAAEWHAIEAARWAAEGRPLRFETGAVAAIAVVNNLALVTSEHHLYEGFAGLRYADWLPPEEQSFEAAPADSLAFETLEATDEHDKSLLEFGDGWSAENVIPEEAVVAEGLPDEDQEPPSIPPPRPEPLARPPRPVPAELDPSSRPAMVRPGPRMVHPRAKSAPRPRPDRDDLTPLAGDGLPTEPRTQPVAADALSSADWDPEDELTQPPET